MLRDFQQDGVRYLELRTTPRASGDSMTSEQYVATVVSALAEFGSSQAGSPEADRMAVYLLLSVDRARHDGAAAEAVVSLALVHQHHQLHHDGAGAGPVVGLDLCGNPLRCADVGIFGPAFARAKAAGLRLALHFAEIPESSTPRELETLLGFGPDRLGHVIHVPDEVCREIALRHIGLELCLSCNVHARLVSGGFAEHHFGYWRDKGCPITLCVSIRSGFPDSVSWHIIPIPGRHVSQAFAQDPLLTLAAP